MMVKVQSSSNINNDVSQCSLQSRMKLRIVKIATSSQIGRQLVKSCMPSEYKAGLRMLVELVRLRHCKRTADQFERYILRSGAAIAVCFDTESSTLSHAVVTQLREQLYDLLEAFSTLCHRLRKNIAVPPAGPGSIMNISQRIDTLALLLQSHLQHLVTVDALTNLDKALQIVASDTTFTGLLEASDDFLERAKTVSKCLLQVV